MTVGNYSPRSIGNYVREMRFIFAYYPDTKPSAITADQVEKHLLPKGFCKIRYYGYLGNYRRKERVNAVLQQMGKPAHPAPVQVSAVISRIEKCGTATMLCPCCKKSPLELLYIRYAGNTINQVLRE